MSSDKITTNSLIPLGLVITLLGAAISFGVMYNKVNTLSDEVNMLRIQTAEINSKVDKLVGRIGLTSLQ